MIIGGMRRVLAGALGSGPPISQQDTTEKRWMMNTRIMGLDSDGG